MKYLIAFTTFAVCALLAWSVHATNINLHAPPENLKKPWRIYANLGSDEREIWFIRSYETRESCITVARGVYMESLRQGGFPSPETGERLPITRMWCKADGWRT